MEETKKDTKVINKQINYIIIEKLWTYVTGEEKSKLYTKLGINKNTYSNIRTGKTQHYSKRAAYARSKLKNLGLPEETMTGEKMIELEGLTRDDWIKYLDWWEKKLEKDDKKGREEKAAELRKMNKRLKDAFGKINPGKKNMTPIEVLYCFFTEDKVQKIEVSDKEMKSLYDSLTVITPKMMIKCDGKLCREIFDVMKEKYEWLDTIIKYGRLFEESSSRE